MYLNKVGEGGGQYLLPCGGSHPGVCGLGVQIPLRAAHHIQAHVRSGYGYMKSKLNAWGLCSTGPAYLAQKSCAPLNALVSLLSTHSHRAYWDQ